MRLLPLLLLACAPASGPRPSAVPCGPGGVHEVEELRKGTNGRTIRAAFRAETTPDTLRVVVRLRLVPASGIAAATLERRKATWASQIRKSWGGRTVVGAHGPLALQVEVAWDGPPHHRVALQPGDGRADAGVWFLDGDDRAPAHEVGHFLGAFDTYPTGTLAPGAVPDLDQLMGDHNRSPVPKDASFDFILSWYGRCTGSPATIR